MKKAAWLRKVAAVGGEFHSVKQDPWKHNALNVTAAVALWSSVAGLLVWGIWAPPALYIPVAAVLMACLFFGHYILVIHECSHNMFLVSKNRKLQKKLNRVVGLVAAHIFFTDYVRHWEVGHTTHHLRPCEEDDPQDREPLDGVALLKRYGILMIPGSTFFLNPCAQYGFSFTRLLFGFMFWGPVFVGSFFMMGWHGPVTLLAAMHVLMMLNLTKKAQEHACGLKDEPMPIQRSRTYKYPLAFLFSPFNINYHFEHHANFNVPWYLLPKYHQRVIALVPEPLRPYYFHREIFKQLAGKKELPPQELRHLFYAEETPASAS